jgi:hypothetical protein
MYTKLAPIAAAGMLLLAVPVAQAADSTVTGAAGGAVAGAVVGGPVGAAVGGVIGAVVGTTIEPPPPQIVTYVEEQPPPPAVTLEGDLAVGATLPPEVRLYPVPPDVYVPGDPRLYAYAEINGRTVIVDRRNFVIIGIVG